MIFDSYLTVFRMVEAQRDKLFAYGAVSIHFHFARLRVLNDSFHALTAW